MARDRPEGVFLTTAMQVQHELNLADVHVQTAGRQIEMDGVPLTYCSNGSTHCCFWCDMPGHKPVGGYRESTIGKESHRRS